MVITGVTELDDMIESCRFLPYLYRVEARNKHKSEESLRNINNESDIYSESG